MQWRPNVMSLVVAEIIKWTLIYMGASLARVHMHFHLGTILLTGIGKPKLNTKFEIPFPNFNRCGNISEIPNIGPSPGPRAAFPFSAILWWTSPNSNCLRNFMFLVLSVAEIIKGTKNYPELSWSTASVILLRHFIVKPKRHWKFEFAGTVDYNKKLR